MPKGIYKHKGHKQSEETKRKIGLANSIKLKGRKLSAITKKKIGLFNQGKVYSEETKRKLSKSQRGYHNSLTTEFKKGHKFSKEVREKISNTLKGRFLGSESPSWKGGMSPLKERIRHSFKNRQWISDVFTRDKFICQICGYSGGRILNAHHVKFFSNIIMEHNIKTYEDAMSCDELWNINNGITLCKNCHTQIHKNLNGWTIEDIKKLKS